MGFGTLDLCREYTDLSAGRFHPYLPLLAVHPDHQGRGHGGTILRHMIAEAALMVAELRKNSFVCQDILYLDVYTDSLAAKAMYDRANFVTLVSESIEDPAESGRRFVVMGKQIGIAPASV